MLIKKKVFERLEQTYKAEKNNPSNKKKCLSGNFLFSLDNSFFAILDQAA